MYFGTSNGGGTSSGKKPLGLAGFAPPTAPAPKPLGLAAPLLDPRKSRFQEPKGLAASAPAPQVSYKPAPSPQPQGQPKGFGLLGLSAPSGNPDALRAELSSLWGYMDQVGRGSSAWQGYYDRALEVSQALEAPVSQSSSGSFGSAAAAPRGGAGQISLVPAPRTGEGLISGGPAGNQVRGAFGGQNAAGVAPVPRSGLASFDPFAYNRNALAGLADATKRLEGLANPWGSAETEAVKQRGLSAYAAQGARDGIHGQNDAINRMMAGGGLLAQQDLNALSDNVRAGVMNQQAGLAAEYNRAGIDWETQRRQEVARQYDRQAGLASSPYQLSQEQLRAETAEQRLWEDRMTAPDRNASARWQAESQRLGVDSTSLDNAIRTLDVNTKRDLYETVIAQGRDEGRISKAEADAAEQLMRQGGDWTENPLLKNILRAVLIGGGAIGGALVGGPAGALTGAGLGGAAAGGIR